MHVSVRAVLVTLILVILIPVGVSALATYNGGQVTISQPVPDDIFASGGTIDVNAPVDSLIVAGGTINVNAPIKGDVIAAGGTINVNNDIGGKLVAAGGNINVNKGIGTNIVLAGGSVNLGQEATVRRDALITGGQISNAGNIAGNLTVRARSFENTGTAGHVDVELSEPREEFSRIFSIFGIIFSLGMLILGLVILNIAPKHFMAVEEEVRKSTLIKTIAGFFAIIVSIIVLILISITIVLLPIALLLWMAFFAALLVSTLFVSLAIGRILARYIKWEAAPWQMFFVGFIVLNLVSRIPVAGIIILVISVSLGFAAFFSTVYHNMDKIRGQSPAE